MVDAGIARREMAIGRPAVRRIGADDIRSALSRGWDDFSANPTHLIFL
jgi:uncharacterized membrane protein